MDIFPNEIAVRIRVVVHQVIYVMAKTKIINLYFIFVLKKNSVQPGE